MSNKHICEFLNYYKDIDNPQYAVLLKGKWGSGKTYYINEYKKSLDNQDYIYVSLYGVTLYEEIETKFLEETNPEIFNGKTLFASKIAASFFNEEVKNTLSIAKKSLSNLNAKGKILIFDDLERCSINIIDLLGYINNFVEHKSYKVILIANEEELEKSEKYNLIKEKLIGKTFELKCNPKLAYESFITEYDSKNKIADNTFIKYEDTILNIFKQTKCNNFRILRQVIFDFRRFYVKCLYQYNGEDSLIKFVLKHFFILSFENSLSSVSIFDQYVEERKRQEENLLILKEIFFEGKEKEEKQIEEETISEKINKKYFFTLDFTVLNIDTWVEIIENAYLDFTEINNQLQCSIYNSAQIIPSWKKLHQYSILTDEEFDLLKKETYKKFKNNEYREFRLVMMISSLLLSLKEKSLLDISAKELLIECKKQISYSVDNNFIDPSIILSFDTSYYQLMKINSYKNLLIEPSKAFKNEFLPYCTKKVKAKLEDKIKEDSYLIIKAIEYNNSDELYNLLLRSDKENASYIDKNIFYYIDIDKFVDSLFNTTNIILHHLGGIIEKRYEINNSTLFTELSFLQNVKLKINRRLKKSEGILSEYYLDKEIITNITIAIDLIKGYESKKN